jgi:hypothetical protein
MRLKFGALDPFDGFPDSAGDFFLFQPAATPAVTNAPLTPVIVPVEAIQAESAQDGPGGPGSVVAETSGGLTIDLIFDVAAMAAPASFRNGVELIQTDGSTNLLQIANNYYLYTNGSGPELKYGGAPVTVGQHRPNWRNPDLYEL